jgi:hypothetical protein
LGGCFKVFLYISQKNLPWTKYVAHLKNKLESESLTSSFQARLTFDLKGRLVFYIKVRIISESSRVLHALLIHIRLACKSLPRTNTLAFLQHHCLRKRHVALTLCFSFIKHFLHHLHCIKKSYSVWLYKVLLS